MKRVVLLRSNPVSPDPPVEKIASALLGFGYEVRILAWDRDNNYKEKSRELNVEGGKVIITTFGITAQYGGRFKSIGQLLFFQIRIANWLIRNHERYDIIHAFDFDTGFIALKCAKKFDKKLVYHILDFYVESHGLHNTQLGKIIRKLEINVINDSNQVIICSEKRKIQIRESHPLKVCVIHNTPQFLSELDTDYTILHDNKICKIVYVGILAKGRFIEEIANIVEMDKRFEFHVGGYGYLEKKISDLAKRYNNIFFYGKLSYTETLSLEKEGDIMTAIYDPSIPNHKYAAPNKFYESLMLGKPIIMVRGTGFDEVVEQKEIGYVIEYSEESLKNGLEELLLRKEKWGEMGERGKRLYQEEFSWEIMRQRLFSVYQEL